MNCLKNLEKEVKELKDLTSSNNANQIKGERQLLDLKDAVNFISNNCDDLEREKTGKGKNYKRIKRRSDLFEGKSGRYNSGGGQAGAVLKEEFPVNTWFT